MISFWGEYLLKKQVFKNIGGIFLCWMGLTAVVCVPSFIAGLTHVNSGATTMPLESTATASQDGTKAQPVESATVLAQAGQSARRSTIPSNAMKITAAEHKTQSEDTLLHAGGQPLQLRVQHVGIRVSNR